MTIDRTDAHTARKSGSDVEGPTGAINLAERFTASPRFEELFSGGMALIEETAAYLDGKGRQDAKTLQAPFADLYGSESMRLTTRLMQMASWLLLQRAVADGEITPEHAATQKKSIKLNRLLPLGKDPNWSGLPTGFKDLAERAHALQSRVMCLDTELYGTSGGGEGKPQQNPVAAQQSLLQNAFDTRFDT